MAVTVSSHPSDCELNVTVYPASLTPSIEGSEMRFSGREIRLNGSVKLLGDPGDSANGWKVGFIQAQWVETNWCSYRGQSNSDGSIFIQRGRAPARSQQACRDCVETTPLRSVFYNTKVMDGEIASGSATDSFPLVLRVKHYDAPEERCPLSLQNSLTGKKNFLREVQFEFLFCTIMSVQDPAGTFQHVMAVYWNKRAQYRFEQPGYLPKANPSGTGSTVGVPFHLAGQMIDPRFASVLTRLTETRSCNDLAIAARNAFDAGAPNRHESPIWKDFNVTAP